MIKETLVNYSRKLKASQSLLSDAISLNEFSPSKGNIQKVEYWRKEVEMYKGLIELLLDKERGK